MIVSYIRFGFVIDVDLNHEFIPSVGDVVSFGGDPFKVIERKYDIKEKTLKIELE